MARDTRYDSDEIDVLGLDIHQISEIGEVYFINEMRPEDIASGRDWTVADVHGAIWFYLKNRETLKSRMGWDEYDSLVDY